MRAFVCEPFPGSDVSLALLARVDSVSDLTATTAQQRKESSVTAGKSPV